MTLPLIVKTDIRKLDAAAGLYNEIFWGTKKDILELLAKTLNFESFENLKAAASENKTKESLISSLFNWDIEAIEDDSTLENLKINNYSLFGDKFNYLSFVLYQANNPDEFEDDDIEHYLEHYDLDNGQFSMFDCLSHIYANGINNKDIYFLRLENEFDSFDFHESEINTVLIKPSVIGDILNSKFSYYVNDLKYQNEKIFPPEPWHHRKWNKYLLFFHAVLFVDIESRNSIKEAFETIIFHLKNMDEELTGLKKALTRYCKKEKTLTEERKVFIENIDFKMNDSQDLIFLDLIRTGALLIQHFPQLKEDFKSESERVLSLNERIDTCYDDEPLILPYLKISDETRYNKRSKFD